MNHKVPSKLRDITTILYVLKRFKSTSYPQIPKSLSYCIELVRKLDHENYVCTLLLPENLRATAFAIRAFNVEISRIQEQTSQIHAGMMRGKFWEDCIDKLYKETPPNHPVIQELYKATKRHKLSKYHFKKLLSSRLNQLNVSTFNDMADMENYADQTCSPILMLLLEAMNVKNTDCDHLASHIGKAQGLSNLIRSLPYNFKQNIILLPRSELLKHKVSEESLMRNSVPQETLSEIIYGIASNANNHLKLATSLKEKVPTECYPIFLTAVPVRMYLNKLEKTNFHIYDKRLLMKNAFLPLHVYWNKLRKTF